MALGTGGRSVTLDRSTSSLSHTEQRTHEWVTQQNNEEHVTLCEYDTIVLLARKWKREQRRFQMGS